jgi:uncharacterized protein YndB with AHSA1/START domain
MSESLALRAFLSAPPESVFRALLDPRDLETWLGEHADVSVDEGRYAFWGPSVPQGDSGRQRLIDADPERSLRFAWKLSGADTEVAITLDPAGEVTELTLVQTGLPERQGAEPSVRDFWWLSLENLANHLEGRPLSPTVDLSTRPAGEASAYVEIDASPERVFAALVEPEQLQQWIAQNAVVEPRVGGRYDFGWDHGPVEIVELVPNERLAYSWRWEDEETVVRWELEGSGGRTRLTLVHSGFGEARHADGYRLGWQAFLGSLRRFVEVGPAWRRPADVDLATR